LLSCLIYPPFPAVQRYLDSPNAYLYSCHLFQKESPGPIRDAFYMPFKEFEFMKWTHFCVKTLINHFENGTTRVQNFVYKNGKVDPSSKCKITFMHLRYNIFHGNGKVYFLDKNSSQLVHFLISLSFSWHH